MNHQTNIPTVIYNPKIASYQSKCLWLGAILLTKIRLLMKIK